MIADIFREVLGAFLPGVGEGDDVVNLDVFREFLFGGVMAGFSGVGLGKVAGDDVATF